MKDFTPYFASLNKMSYDLCALNNNDPVCIERIEGNNPQTFVVNIYRTDTHECVGHNVPLHDYLVTLLMYQLSYSITKENEKPEFTQKLYHIMADAMREIKGFQMPAILQNGKNVFVIAMIPAEYWDNPLTFDVMKNDNITAISQDASNIFFNSYERVFEGYVDVLAHCFMREKFTVAVNEITTSD